MDIKVSIVCKVFNHDKYLRKNLEGIVSQNTNFEFEAIVHDDASTDSSKKIIEEFASKYPNIIKPIYQTENQYQQGIATNIVHIMPRCKGKYIAICEGDDYWTDSNKLQKQYSFMSSNPNCTLTAHAVTWVNNKTKESKYFGPSKEDRFFSADEVILGGGGFVATCSLMVKKELYFIKPDCFSYKGVGDYQLQMYCAFSGDFYYFSDCMGVYNYLSTSTSWSSKRKTTNRNPQKVKAITYIGMLENIDKYYGYKYTKSFSEVIRKEKFKSYLKNGEYKLLKVKEFEDLFNKLSLKRKTKINIGAHMPWLLELIDRKMK